MFRDAIKEGTTLGKKAKEHIKDFAIVGGASANKYIREAYETLSKKFGKTMHVAPLAYCSDNAAMIGRYAIDAYKKEQEKLNNSTDDSEDELDEVEYEEEVYENETDDINLFFAFVPTETVIEKADFMTYLVNDSNYYVMFNIYSDSVGEFWNKHAIMEPNSKELLDTFANTKINELEKFSFQFLFFKNGKHDKKAAIQKDLKINVKNFFSNKKFIANDFFYEDSMILPLLTEDGMRDAMENLVKKDIEEALRIKLKSQNQEKALGFAKKIHPQNKENVIDLHIHELIDDERGFSRNELLDLQMKKFLFKMMLTNLFMKIVREIVDAQLTFCNLQHL